jgi:hypothetical protein
MRISALTGCFRATPMAITWRRSRSCCRAALSARSRPATSCVAPGLGQEPGAPRRALQSSAGLQKHQAHDPRPKQRSPPMPNTDPVAHPDAWFISDTEAFLPTAWRRSRSCCRAEPATRSRPATSLCRPTANLTRE